MKRINKKGFTLIEMVLVIAIIVILAAVVAFSIGGYLNRAKNAASSVDSHNDAIESARDRVDAELER